MLNVFSTCQLHTFRSTEYTVQRICCVVWKVYVPQCYTGHMVQSSTGDHSHNCIVLEDLRWNSRQNCEIHDSLPQFTVCQRNIRCAHFCDFWQSVWDTQWFEHNMQFPLPTDEEYLSKGHGSARQSTLLQHPAAVASINTPCDSS